MFEIIENIGKVSGTLMTIITFMAFVLPKTRKFIVNWLKDALEINLINERLKKREENGDKINNTVEEIQKTLVEHIAEYKVVSESCKERDIFMLRESINNIYYKYIPLGYITIRAKKDLIEAFALYEKLGGNTYAKEEVEELLKLPVKF